MTLVQTEPKKIYIWVEATPITTAGIYYNSDLGLISLSSDGSTRYTISDKNVGATEVWNYGDSLSDAKVGNYYQRGNNHGWSYTDAVNGNITKSSTQVNASTYGPNNYYNSSTFIKGSTSAYSWDSSQNRNLRGDTTGTSVARRGPCDEGWHVPSNSELTSLLGILQSLGFLPNSEGTSSSYFTKVIQLFAMLHLPSVGDIFWTTGNYDAPTATSPDFYFVSTELVKYQNVYSKVKCLHIYANTNNSVGGYYISPGNMSMLTPRGQVIRPFKNEAVQPREGWTRLDA